MALRVLLVDDHAGFRQQARQLLEAEGLNVVGEATSGAQALDLLRDDPADVVVLDVVLPGRDGIDVADEIAALHRPPAVILTSSRSATDFGDRLALAPVRGFLPKADLSAAAIDRLLRSGGSGSRSSQPATAATAASTLPGVEGRPPGPPVSAGPVPVAAPARPFGPRWLRIVAWPATVLVGLFAVQALLRSPLLPTGLIEDEVVDPRQVILAVTLIGGSTALAGLGAWWRRPDRFAGPLLVAAAWAWFIGATSWAIGGGALQGYYVLLIAGLVLAYPSGRLGAVPRLILVAMLAVVLASTLGRMLFEANPGGFSANCYPPEPLCAPVPGAFVDAALGGGNSDELDLYDNLDLWFQLALLAGAALAVAVVAGRWVLATGPRRRVLAPPLAMGVALTAAVAVAVVQRQSSVSSPIPGALGTGLALGLAAMPHAFTWDLVQGRLARAKVADLVVSLGAGPGPEGMRGALSRALSDRSVSVLVWSGEAGGYLDEAGNPAELPGAGSGSGRSFTVLERQGQPLGAIVYDAALREDPALLDSVAAAAATAIENDRLQSEVEAQLAEVQASRARIVAAGDQQRERLERDLHDGAQQQLVALAIELRSARLRVDPAQQPELAEALANASARAESAVGELRELAQGIHPVVLTEAGLAAGIESLARRATIPVTVDADIPHGLPPAVETTAYFLVSEALANVAKHAGASGAQVRASVAGDVLRIEIADDGIGGADPANGTGLRGLTDRVAAVGGSLFVLSPARGGTQLLAEIPCAS